MEGLRLLENVKTLLLVDGSSYLYRAFHAMPDLRTAAGEPTGAIRGFIGMLRTLREQVPAEYLACVFDAKGKTFRDDIYPDYKAQRAPMPEDLVRQIGPIHEAVRAMGWPLIEVQGIEADDVIGTLVRHAESHGVKSIVSTGDKDMAQLVNEHVTLVNTMSNETLDVAGVEAKFGVPPERIVDYLTLVGDTVDNVPGVEKVGPKTAVKWLTQYGSLDAIVAQADQVGGKVGENLRKALPWLPTARVLVTIKTDGDIAAHVPHFDALLAQDPQADRLRELFERWEFRGWSREMAGGAPAKTQEAKRAAQDTAPADLFAAIDEPVAPAAPAAPDTHYETVLTEGALERWLERIESASLTAIDTETTSLDPLAARLVGISLAVKEHEGCYIPLAHRHPGAPEQLPLEATLARLKPWLESPQHRKVLQNAKYDSHVLANHGVRLAGLAHDTLLESYVIEAHKSHDMDSLAERWLGRQTLRYEEVCGKGASQIGFDEVEIERATQYAAEDAEITLALHHAMFP
ncbi:MAG: 5'-3' exonuclease H3TH domain-containing protein, partial [Burkholderiaceae bacterium]